jgi:phosphatidylserine/phosphatidylglycerophosphate/cardiolipin synthase-like enzyme
MLTALLIPAAFTATIVTCFAPEQDCAGLAISAIDAARREILVNAYAFTTGSGIPAALNRAHARGVDVRLVADRRAPCDLQEGVSALADAGIPAWIDARARVVHEKALIIDRRVTIMGSYNWSKGAASNSEDLNVVTSSEVAETYAKHWQARQAVSIRFAAASQWCRGGNDRAGSSRRQPPPLGPRDTAAPPSSFP